jgi:hypothetical protein
MDTLVFGLAEEHPVLSPVVGIGDQLEALAAQGVEGVGYEEASRTVGTVCS